MDAAFQDNSGNQYSFATYMDFTTGLFGRTWHRLQSADSKRQGFDGESLFVSRPCEAEFFKCDHCALQSVCQWEFQNGKTCPIIDHGQVWLRVDPMPND